MAYYALMQSIARINKMIDDLRQLIMKEECYMSSSDEFILSDGDFDFSDTSE